MQQRGRSHTSGTAIWAQVVSPTNPDGLNGCPRPAAQSILHLGRVPPAMFIGIAVRASF